MFELSKAAGFNNLVAMYQAASLDPGGHSALRPVARQANHMEWLYWVIFWICFVAFVLTVLAFFTGAARRYVAQSTPLPPIKEHPADGRAAWFVGTAIAVTVLSLFLLGDKHLNFFRSIGIAFIVGGVSVLGMKK